MSYWISLSKTHACEMDTLDFDTFKKIHKYNFLRHCLVIACAGQHKDLGKHCLLNWVLVVACMKYV